jgi:hypothetical protein
MKKHFLACLTVTVMAATSPFALGQDAEACLDCHEPAEDWEGMSVDEIVVLAKDPDNKRHRDHDGLSDEQLREIVITLTE